jgi:hypothetical protein
LPAGPTVSAPGAAGPRQIKPSTRRRQRFGFIDPTGISLAVQIPLSGCQTPGGGGAGGAGRARAEGGVGGAGRGPGLEGTEVKDVSLSGEGQGADAGAGKGKDHGVRE